MFPESSLDFHCSETTSMNFLAHLTHQQEETHSVLNVDDGGLLLEESLTSLAPSHRCLKSDDGCPHLNKFPPGWKHSGIRLDASCRPDLLLHLSALPVAEGSLNADC